jgi:hypothetical protein
MHAHDVLHVGIQIFSGYPCPGAGPDASRARLFEKRKKNVFSGILLKDCSRKKTSPRFKKKKETCMHARAERKLMEKSSSRTAGVRLLVAKSSGGYLAFLTGESMFTIVTLRPSLLRRCARETFLGRLLCPESSGGYLPFLSGESMC